MIERNERKPYWRHTKVQMLTSLLPFVRGHDRSPALRRRPQRQAHPRHAARLFPRLPRPHRHRLRDHCRRSSIGRMPSITGTARTRTSDGMAFTSRTRLVNPRLGTYFGIFTAAFAALVLMALMFEQLGATDGHGAPRHVRRPHRALCGDRLRLRGARGRRTISPAAAGCPPSSTGWCSPSRRSAAPASWRSPARCFIVGFDAMCLSIGWCAGLVFMGVLFAPFVRKFGAYTVPTFLGRRFESRTVRVVAAAILSRADPPPARGRGALCRLCRGLDARPIGAADGGRGRGLRRGHRARSAACARSPGRASPRPSPRCWRWRCPPASSPSWSPTCRCRR